MKKNKLWIFLFYFLALSVTMAHAASQWDKTEPKGTTEINDYDVVIPANNEAIDRLLTNYRQGVRINYSSSSALSLSAGEVVCSNSDGSVRRFRKNTSATTVDWDDIDTSSEEASETYYVYAVADTDATTFTFKISKSATSPTGATYFKKLGSFYNNSDSDITRIDNDSEEWEFGAPVSKSEDTAYKALTDGVVVAMLEASADDTGTSVIIYSDSSSSPTTVVSAMSLGGGAAVDPGIYLTAVYPVKAGDYYKVAMSNNSESSTISFIPKQ